MYYPEPYNFQHFPNCFLIYKVLHSVNLELHTTCSYGTTAMHGIVAVKIPIHTTVVGIGTRELCSLTPQCFDINNLQCSQ